MRLSVHFPIWRSVVLVALTALLAVPSLFAQDLKPIQLPKPQIAGGKAATDCIERASDLSYLRKQAAAATSSFQSPLGSLWSQPSA